MNQEMIWAEMARRKVRFHKNENWQVIRLWGLYSWGVVSKLLEKGELITDIRKENKTVWVWPSEEAYYKYIEPLIATYTLDELTRMAGWDI